MPPQLIHHHFLRLCGDTAVLLYALQQVRGSDVRSHDQYGVLKIYSAPLGISDPAVVKHLKQYIEHIRVGFLHLVKQHHRIGLPSDGLRKLPSLLIANIAGRRSNQAGYGIFFHIFAHVDTHHIVFVVEQSRCQGFGQFRLAHAGGAQEQERADGLARILDPRLGADDGLADLGDALVLADHSPVQFLVQMQGFVALALRQLGHRDAGPPGDDLGDLLIGHFLMHQGHIPGIDLLLFDFQLLFQCGQRTIA